MLFVTSGREGVPLPTSWTFTAAIRAAAHCTCAALRPPGFACFRSPLAGRGTPSLVHWPYLTATRRQEAANEHQRAAARQGKADRTSVLSVKQPPPRSSTQ